MVKTFDGEPIYITDKCSKCKISINKGIPLAKLNNGDLVILCEPCHSEYKFRGGRM
jgi:hypothetical protein